MAHPYSFSWFGKKKAPAVEQGLDSVAAVIPVSGDAAPVSAEKRSYSLSDPRFWGYFNLGRESMANVDVTYESSMGVPPFFCAVRYITEGIAMLDRKVKIKGPDGKRDAENHPIWSFVNNSPHPLYTWFDLICAVITNACLGNGYIRIHWNYSTMRPEYFEHIPSIYCRPEFDGNGNLWYLITGFLGGKTVIERIPYTDIIHIKGLSLDGILGLDITITHQATLATGIARQEYTESVLGKGARPSLAIRSKETLSPKEVETMEDNVMARIGGTAKAGRPLILDNDQEVQYLQWSPLEAALDQLAKLNVEDCSRLTKVPRDLLGLENGGTYGAGVQRSQDFLTHCLSPWIEKFQEEFDRKVFWETELRRSDRVHYEFDTSMFTALNQKDKSAMLVSEVAGTIRTPNEARTELGLSPVEGGDELLTDINLLPMSKAVEIALAKYLSAAGEKLRGESQNDLENEPDKSGSKSEN